jgi:hypothetical protein
VTAASISTRPTGAEDRELRRIANITPQAIAAPRRKTPKTTGNTRHR